jgi:O-antigen ligase
LYLVRFVAYAGLFFVVRDLLKLELLKRLKLSFLLIAVGVGSAVLGLLQYFLYPNLRNLAYLGWDPHYKRLFGAFLDPQFAGVVLALTAILLFYRAINGSTTKSINKNIVMQFIASVIFISLLLTYSRSSYLALIGGLLALGKLGRLGKYGKLRILGILTIAVLLVLWFARPDGVGGNLLRKDTVDSRINSWGEAIRIWKEKPIFGVGFNMYRYAHGKPERTRIERMFTNQTNRAGAGVDNSFLFVLATTGILGFLAYLRIWRELVKSAPKSASSLTKAIMVALFIHAGFNNTLFYPHIMWWTWVYFSQFSLPSK